MSVRLVWRWFWMVIYLLASLAGLGLALLGAVHRDIRPWVASIILLVALSTGFGGRFEHWPWEEQ